MCFTVVLFALLANIAGSLYKQFVMPSTVAHSMDVILPCTTNTCAPALRSASGAMAPKLGVMKRPAGAGVGITNASTVGCMLQCIMKC